jgi:DNA-binding NarL/FixJ family response regulator
MLCRQGLHERPAEKGRCEPCRKAADQRNYARVKARRQANPSPAKRTPPNTAKLSREQIDEIAEDLARGNTIEYLAWFYSVSERTIERIKAGTYRKAA